MINLLPASARFHRVKFFAVILLSTVFISLKASCAGKDSANQAGVKNTFYIEFAGKANYHSINFMHTFRSGKTISYSYSIGYSPMGADFSFPLSLNAFTTGKTHHYGCSLGVIPYVEHHQKAKRIDSDKQVLLAPGFDYIFQKSKSGLFLKAGVAAQVQVDPPSRNVMAMSVNVLKPAASIAIGFSF